MGTKGEKGMAALRSVPEPPCRFSAEQFFSGVHWHQRWEVFRGVHTPGRNPVAELSQQIGLPEDLRGKRVLDVGAWHGCFSFECERRGADEVVAYSLEDPEETGFNRLKKALGSRVEYHRGSVYSLSPRAFGTFDVVLFLGVLYHLRYPLLGIDRVRSVARDLVFVESHVIDEAPYERTPDGTGSTHPASQGTPLWRQYMGGELTPGDESNWFSPNVRAAVEALESAGFTVESMTTWAQRGAFRCRAAPIPGRLRHGSYEACDPNKKFVGLVPGPTFLSRLLSWAWLKGRALPRAGRRLDSAASFDASDPS
jgi:tRNA (mo5U34)-methyltransferase